MDLSFWAATDVGRKRTHNEDNFLVDQKLSLFVVADGMGGHAAGEVASPIAVHEYPRRRAQQPRPDRALPRATQPGVQTYADPLSVLEHAVQTACGPSSRARAGRAGQARHGHHLLGAAPSPAIAGFIAHVGDSRIYMLRPARVQQLTEDHSLMNELVRRGKVNRERFNPPRTQYKNAVTRAVGVVRDRPGRHLRPRNPAGDQFLLCSDGLYAYLDDSRAPRQLAERRHQRVPRSSVDIANTGGGHDNITAVVIRVAAARPRRPARAPRAGAQGRGAAGHAALPAPDLQGDPPRPHVTSRRVRAGRGNHHRGRPGEELFVLLSGKMRLHKDGAITHLPRAPFGEMALVDRRRARPGRPPRSPRACYPAPVRLLRDHPQGAAAVHALLWAFVQVLAERLRKTTAELSGARLEAGAEDLTADIMFEE